MRVRRIFKDTDGRVPFAMVAALILMLSIFSTAYLSGIQRQEASRRLISIGVDRQSAVILQVEDSMALEAYYLATDAVVSCTQVFCNQSMLDKAFQENYSAYLSQRFPFFSDPYSIEVRNFNAQVYLEERNIHDLVESNETTEKEVRVEDQNGNVASEEAEILDASKGETYNETAALSRFVVVGHGNCSVMNTLSGSMMERPISFEKAIDSPFPLMNSKLLELGAEGDSNAMSLARITKYVLSTIAQYRVLQGFGSGLGNAPGETGDILTRGDVQLAVNFAILLETSRIFRSYDADLALALDAEYPDSGAETMSGLIGKYMNTGTLDPADIVAMYMEIDKEQLPIDMIIGQAVNAVIDQFVLKYLDYFGIADIANSVYKNIQKLGKWIEDVGKELSAFIFGDDGEARKEVEQVTNFISRLMKEASQTPNEMHWPPDVTNVTNPKLLLSTGNISSTNLSIFDVLEPIDERYTYFANCSQLQSMQNETVLDTDAEPIGTRYHLTLLYRNITVLTQRSADTSSPLGYLVDFPQASMLRRSPEMNETWKTFYDSYYATSENIIYDTIRDMVKNVSAEIASLLTLFIVTKDLSLGGYKNGAHAINPKDMSSTLQNIRDVIDEAVRDTIAYLQQNSGNINAMIGALADKHSQLTLRFIEFVNLNYETLVDKSNAIDLARVSLVNSILGNASITIDNGYTSTQNYILYNDLGHQRGFVDEPITSFNCTAEPDRQLEEYLIAGQNFANLTSTLQPYIDHAYNILKDTEVKYDYFGSEENGIMLKALEGTVKTQQTRILSLFTGQNQNFGLITMAGDFIDRVTSGIIWGGEVANTQYCPEIIYSDTNGPIPFDFYEGNYSSALSAGSIRYDSFEVDMTSGFLTAIDPGYALEPCQVPFGFLATNISEPMGRHYTDITCFNERPFETSWNVTVTGRFEVLINSKSMVYLGNGTHEPAFANNTVEIDLDIPIVVYSGWNLANVEYESTSTLAGAVKKVLDIIGDFLKWVWDALTAPINWIIDQVMKVVNFFSDIIGTLLSYAAKVVNLLVDIVGCLVGLVQWFMKSIAKLVLNSIVKWIIDLLPDDVSFEFSMFGFTFNITFAPSSAIQQADEGENAVLMSIRTMGRLFGLGFDIGLQLCALSEEIADRIGLSYDVLLWSIIDLFGFFTLETRLDPLMATSERLMEIHGDGETWGLEIVIPEVEVYDSVQFSLQDIPGISQALSNIPIPFLGVEASVNAGLNIQYTMKGLEADNVVINEVELNPRGWDSGNDWVELYNPTEEKVNLAGWTLGSRTHPIVNRTLLPDTAIEPEGFYKIQYENMSIPDYNISYQLLDPGGLVVDSTPLLSECNNTTIQGIYIDALGCHKTWQRTPNGANLSIAGEWRFSNCTPNSENVGMDITFRDVVKGLLKTAFNNTWHALKDKVEISLTFITTLVKEFIKRFVDDVLTVVEKCVLNTILFIDVQLRDMSGSLGGGISLSFVIEGGSTLRQLLEWVIGSLAVFLAKISKANQPSQYPKLAEGVPEHLYVRLDVYAFVKVPGVFKRMAIEPDELGMVKVGARIEANIPALAALIGKDMGRWQINFGVYIENLPAQIADQLFDTGEDVTPNVWIMKGMVYEK